MGEPRPPPFIICHLCGRKYGSKSIDIHIPQCEEKWEAENKKLPKSRRRSMPSRPDHCSLQSGNYTAAMIDEMNQKAFEVAQAQLIPCKHCGRTFYPEKLPVHQKSCTAERPCRVKPATEQILDHDTFMKKKNSVAIEKRVTKKKKTQSKVDGNNNNNNSSESLILCSICMKQIPTVRIEVHLVCCNQEKIKQIESAKRLEKGGSPPPVSRPRTRTIYRTPILDVDSKDGTYDIITKNTCVTESEGVAEEGSEELTPCDLCKRKFLKDRIKQHKTICSKVKTRKKFDSCRQRLAGLNVNNVQKDMKSNGGGHAKTNWRQKHQELIQSIRAARQVASHVAKGGKASDLPPPPPSLNEDYILCQYCKRKFNSDVAEKHIPKCARIINRPAPPKKRAVDEYNSNDVKASASIKKSNTFNVKESEKKFSDLKEIGFGVTYNAKEFEKLRSSREISSEEKDKKKENTFCGYISPRVERKRFESLNGSQTKIKRPFSSSGGTFKNSLSSSLKEKQISKNNSTRKQNTAFSYNSVHKTRQIDDQNRQKELKDFLF